MRLLLGSLHLKGQIKVLLVLCSSRLVGLVSFVVGCAVLKLSRDLLFNSLALKRHKLNTVFHMRRLCHITTIALSCFRQILAILLLKNGILQSFKRVRIVSVVAILRIRALRSMCSQLTDSISLTTHIQIVTVIIFLRFGLLKWVQLAIDSLLKDRAMAFVMLLSWTAMLWVFLMLFLVGSCFFGIVVVSCMHGYHAI